MSDKDTFRLVMLDAYGHQIFDQTLGYKWYSGGRQKVLDLKKGIEARGSLYQSDKCLMVMRSMFEYATYNAWMQPPNPALGSKGPRSKHEPKHHPTLEWEQLPQFFEDLERNDPKGNVVVVSAVKMFFLTFLRVSSWSGLRWEEIDYKKSLCIIPAERMKAKQDHKIPLTNQIKEVLEKLHEVTGNEECAFYNGMGRKYPHIDPSSINNHLVRLG